jgi:curli biogenesis system outer membrane secretion channel CsgG
MNGYRWLLASLVTLAAVGTAGAADPPRGGGPDISSAQAERYDGPKARLAVKDFEDKMASSGQYRAEYGRGLRDILTTALFQTNRYIILEREKLGGVVDELKHGTSDLFRKEATVPLGELEGAELLVAAAVTGFDPGTSGLGGNIGGLIPGRLGSVLGGIGIGVKKASIAMDLRVIDVRTGRVVAATAAQGEASAFAAGVGGAGGGLGGGLGGFAKTPMETAIREMVQKAVEFVVAKTPAIYYRHGAAVAATAPGATPPAAAPAGGGDGGPTRSAPTSTATWSRG